MGIDCRPEDQAKGWYGFQKIARQLANKLIRWLTGVHIHNYWSSLKIFRTDIAKIWVCMGSYTALFRYWPKCRALLSRR